jgi:hypothetical protein
MDSRLNTAGMTAKDVRVREIACSYKAEGMSSQLQLWILSPAGSQRAISRILHSCNALTKSTLSDIVTLKKSRVDVINQKG